MLRLKDDYDGAEPSGNSVLALGLLRLARMTGREDFLSAAERTLQAFAYRLQNAGPRIAQMLVAGMFLLDKPMEIVLSGPDDQLGDMLKTIRSRFLPNAVVMKYSESPQPLPASEGPPPTSAKISHASYQLVTRRLWRTYYNRCYGKTRSNNFKRETHDRARARAQGRR